MRKPMFIVIIIIAIVGVVLTIFYFRYKDLINYIDQGIKFEYKVFSSPNNVNRLTMLIENKGDLLHYDSFIYIIEGEYKMKALPEGRNYIKYPNDTGVSLNWENDNQCKIISSNEPVLNKLIPAKFEINLIVDKTRIRSLTKEGKVYRYSIKPFMLDKD